MENKNSERYFDDDKENLRIENEILKLKLTAERGAYFGENAEDIPPEIEAEFLKNIQLFEDSFENAEEITLYECIGKPVYKSVNGLSAEEIKDETKRLLKLLHSKNIVLDVMGQYDLTVIYKFITDELFNQKIREINVPGYMHHFVYEEFHPNHALDIENAAQEFLDDWFEKRFNEYSSELADEFVSAEGTIYCREEVLQRLENCLDSYKRFDNVRSRGNDISFSWNDKAETGLGHAEGVFSYDAEIENGEVIHIEGPYKLYMMNEFGLWKIFYFVFPGFSW